MQRVFAMTQKASTADPAGANRDNAGTHSSRLLPPRMLTLEQRLAAYDRKRHGGEQMALTTTLGAERW
jgi:hypothetical protein